jgi:hypothetical protein
MRCKRGNKPSLFVASLTAHGVVVCCLPYKAWFVASYKAWFDASCKAWFVAFFIKPGWLPLLHLIVLWFVVSLIKPGSTP